MKKNALIQMEIANAILIMHDCSKTTKPEIVHGIQIHPWVSPYEDDMNWVDGKISEIIQYYSSITGNKEVLS